MDHARAKKQQYSKKFLAKLDLCFKESETSASKLSRSWDKERARTLHYYATTKKVLEACYRNHAERIVHSSHLNIRGSNNI